ncbi:MAG: tetratricopeptide repeat protein [Cyanobacteria bacterium P01_D01_bin.50]
MLNIKKIYKLVSITVSWLGIFIFIFLFPIQIALAAPQVNINVGASVVDVGFDIRDLTLFRANYYLQSDETKNKTEALKQQYEDEPVLDYINGIDASQEGDFKKAIGYFSDALKKDGNFAEAYVARGRVYSQWGDNHLKEAIRSYTEALEKPPKFAPDPSRFVEPLLGRAAVYRKLGKDKAALDDLNRVIEQNPDFYDAYLARADIYTKNNDTKDASPLGDRDLALKDLNTAIYLKPDYPAALLARGLIQAELEKDKEAISNFYEVIQSDEADAAAYYNDAYYYLGLIYLKLAQEKQAIQAFSSAVKPNEKGYDFKHYADAYYNRGLVYSKLENYAEAVEDFTKALNYINKEILPNPTKIDAYYYRGNANFELWNLQQSVADYTKVISLKPNFALAYYNRCISYRFQNNFDKAIQDCKKAILLDPKMDEANNTLWAIYILKEGLKDGYIHIEIHKPTLWEYINSLFWNLVVRIGGFFISQQVLQD